MRKLIFIFLIWTYHSLAPSECRKKTKFVTTFIDAKWYQTPIVLEVAEFLADENIGSFWYFINDISNLETSLCTLENEKTKYEIAISKAAKYLSSMQFRLLKFSLSLHVYSPRIEMYSQIGSQRKLPCPITVDVSGKMICSIDEVKETIENSIITSKSDVFHFDHHYPGGENRTQTVILYGEIGTPDFKIYHQLLEQYSLDGKIDYILRHQVQNRLNQKVRLSGYGVELQMKSTEYKAQDDSMVNNKQLQNISTEEEDVEIEGFNFKILKNLHSDKTEELDKFRQYLESSSDELKPLKVWQFQELSLQAAEKIMNEPGDKALNTLIHIAQNFPMQTRSLVDIRVKPERKKEIQKNQDEILMMLNLPPSDTALFLNGMFFDMDVVDIFSILETIKQELRVMEGLYRIGINNRKVVSSILSLDLSSSGNDEYAIDIRDSAVQWINDIENESRYKRWSSLLTDLLKPSFPGMLRSIRRNMYNLVIICDPAKRVSWPLLKLAESFVVHIAPVRVGLVFSTPPPPISGLESASVALLNAFNYVAEEKDHYAGLSFITEVYATIKTERDVEVEDVKKRLQSLSYGADILDILGPDSDYNTGRQLAAEFISRSGLRSIPQALLNGVPLPQKTLNKDDFEEAMLTEIMSQTPVFQKAVYRRELTDSDDVLNFIMNRPNVMPRLNSRILNSDKSTFLDFSDSLVIEMVERMKYVTKKKPGTTSLLTFWIVADFETRAGRNLLQNGLEYLDSSSDSRIGVIVNRSEKGTSSIINKFILSALYYERDVWKILKNADAIIKEQKTGADFDLQDVDWEEMEKLIVTGEKFCKQVLHFKPGHVGIIANGKIVGPLDENEEFVTADYILLERHALKSSVDKIYKALESKLNIMEGCKSNIFMKAVALFANRPQSKSRFQLTGISDNFSVVKLPASSPDEPVLEITVIVDPVSRGAQKVGPIISVLRQVLNTEIKIFLNCEERLSDMPLKSYYRYVLEPELRFTSEGNLENGPIANFSEVSHGSLLTQNMHVPENWLVESVVTPYDLDNIRLQDVDSSVYSQFELEHLLLEGHCFDIALGMPPRGLQITLGTETNPVMFDTIVMANLGYYQLKANPGAWVLRLRQGRSADIYEIVSHEGSDTPPNSTDIKVLISSFQSHVMKLKVNKKPEKIHEDLLEDDTESKNGLWSSIANTFSRGSSGGKDEKTEDETINIFSVASGHLYERFLRIMMLSVIKHTKSPVKFWFLKNYLSPSFKDFLPKMAKKYGFKYELVQYKWPRWLHQQHEKQRIIWGYKILFLDVLFPLDVKKIIFVDADQVVRTDLKELVDFDLQGAPYGYTPFCDSRKEMDGFRFWKQGYWKTHLQGRSYHISALYVVDLKRFRKIAAGDRLRGQYQALSQDPNSLSNLDQDLPNNMIHQVAIKSLPQEWLWCETWCDDASKEKAKTIDLCNNPLTKEAKLTAAMRIVSEWKDYDAEIKRLQLEIDEHTEEEEEEEIVVASSRNPPYEKHTEL